MGKVTAPFTAEQVAAINNYQNLGFVHEFTCGSPEEIAACKRKSGENPGSLRATEVCLVCPCGKYTQDWVHDYMADQKQVDEMKSEHENFMQGLKNRGVK